MVLDGVELRWGVRESARLLQPWQLELVILCACRFPPVACSNALPKLNLPCPKASMTIVSDWLQWCVLGVDRGCLDVVGILRVVQRTG